MKRRHGLRVALVYHGRIVDDLTLSGAERVRVGEHWRNRLLLRPVGLCEGFELLDFDGEGCCLLRVGSETTGLLFADGHSHHLGCAEPVAVPGLSVGGAFDAVGFEPGERWPSRVLELPLRPGDWAVLEVDELRIVIQFVIAPCVLRRDHFLRARWAGLSRSVGSTLGVAIMLSFVFQSLLLFRAQLSTEEVSARVRVATGVPQVEYQGGVVEESRELDGALASLAPLPEAMSATRPRPGPLVAPEDDRAMASVGATPVGTSHRRCAQRSRCQFVRDARSIDAVLKDGSEELDACFAEAESGDSRQARLLAALQIDSAGVPRQARIIDSELNDDVLEACFLGALEGLRFPAPLAGGCQVELPLSVGQKEE